MVRERTENKQERRESATNIRGGIGVRKRLEEEALRTTYRLNGVQTGSIVARAHDRYRGDFTKGYDLGILARKTSQTVFIQWLGDEDLTYYSQGDARYEVDRGRWKFLGVPRKDPLNPDDPTMDALTELRRNAMMMVRQIAATPPTEESKTEEDAMSESKAAQERRMAQEAAKSGSLAERDTYTAKQVATRLGTDAKTMRKFFRSQHSTVEPVGQGGRYEFDAGDMPQIKAEFTAWQKKSKARTNGTNGTARKGMQQIAKTIAPKVVEELDEDDPENEIDAEYVEATIMAQYDQEVVAQDREPTAEELEEVADLDLDLDDLDAEED